MRISVVAKTCDNSKINWISFDFSINLNKSVTLSIIY